MDILLIVGISVIALGLIGWLGGWIFVRRTIARRQSEARGQEQRVVLSIKVSRVNEQGPIAAEQMFASIHGMLKELTFAERWEGEYQEHLSFEIVCHHRSIEFFVSTPSHLREFVEGQIYAQYPDVEIREVDDYTREVAMETTVGTVAQRFNEAPTVPLLTQGSSQLPVPTQAHAESAPTLPSFANATPPPPEPRRDGILHAKVATATEIVLTKDTALPIKLASEFGAVDPLSGITATLGKLDAPNEEVWLQILVRPTPDSWQERGVKLAETLRSGKAPGKAAPLVLRILLWPFTALAGLVKFLTPSSDDSGASKPAGEQKKDLSESDKRFVDGVIAKAGKLGYEVKIRAVFLSGNLLPAQVAKTRLQSIVGSFKQFNTTMLNGFAAKPLPGLSALDAYRSRSFPGSGFILNIEELATLYHLPNVSVKTPNIVWVTSKKTEPPVNLPTIENTPVESMTIMGETTFRGYTKVFGIKTKDRMRHMYIIGKTGMGKSVLLENISISDVRAGRGITVVDPHGDLADHVLESIPPWRAKDVIVFDPSDTSYPVALNLLENINPEYRPLIASGIVAIFYKLFANSWGPRLEHVLRNTLLALLETPGTTLLGVLRMLVDQGYRDKIVSNVTDPVVRSFWVDEFANFKPQNLSEIVGPIQNKVGQFLSSHVIRNILGQPKSTINIRQLMDEKKIFICNLSKGRLGDDASALLGSMLITKIQLDAMSRANVPEDQRIDHHLVVDEFQNFATDAFATILSEARKYKLSLTMANQYVAQMSEAIRGAVFGNVGTLISFQTGYDDATYFANQYAKTVTDVDIMGLDKFTVYVRLLIDNMPTAAFSAKTPPPPSINPDPVLIEEIRTLSRDRYGHPRAEVEEAIRTWSEEGRAPSANRGPKIDPASIPLGSELAATTSNIDEKLGIFIDYLGLGGLVHQSEIPDKTVKTTLKKGDPITVWLIGTKGEKLSCTLNAKKAEALRKLNPAPIAAPELQAASPTLQGAQSPSAEPKDEPRAASRTPQGARSPSAEPRAASRTAAPLTRSGRSLPTPPKPKAELQAPGSKLQDEPQAPSHTLQGAQSPSAEPKDEPQAASHTLQEGRSPTSPSPSAEPTQPKPATKQGNVLDLSQLM